MLKLVIDLKKKTKYFSNIKDSQSKCNKADIKYCNKFYYQFMVDKGKSKGKLRFAVYVYQTGSLACLVSNINTITFVGESSAQIQSGNNSIESIKDTRKVNIKIGDSLHVLSESDVSIECLASGTPRPVINWRWNGRPVVSGARRGQYAIKDITDGSHLTIWQITSENAGQYECIAFNTGGAERSTSSITVIGTCLI